MKKIEVFYTDDTVEFLDCDRIEYDGECILLIVNEECIDAIEIRCVRKFRF